MYERFVTAFEFLSCQKRSLSSMYKINVSYLFVVYANAKTISNTVMKISN